MNAKRFSDAMSELDSKYIKEALNYKKDINQKKKKSGWMKWGLTAACLALIIITVTTAVAVSMGHDLVGWIGAALTQHGDTTEPAGIQAQIDAGQWVYLNDDNIAVILPESPTKILLSRDGGETWKEAVVEGSDKMVLFGDLRENVAPSGGFIGFWGDGGYLVLTASVAMGNQPMRIYLTDNGGDTWEEIENPYNIGEHHCVVTGAGFSTEEIGFISYRYYEDAGPDIWWTSDGGDTWQELMVTLPEEYSSEEYVFTPLSPTFNGSNGIYPIKVVSQAVESTEMIYLYSDDYGITWDFH